VRAHLPSETFYKAFQFPDRLVPVIDGDLGDWKVVEQSYIITTEDFFDLVRPEDDELDPVDFSVRLMVGWTKTENKLFFAAQVNDDMHQVDRPAGTAAGRIFQDDDMEVYLDADHSGGQYANFVDLPSEEQLALNGSAASHFVIAGPPPDGDFFVNFSAAAWYALPDGPFTKAAYSHGLTETGSVTTYELMLEPFDQVNMDAAILSTKHTLQEGEILGFNVEFSDFDGFSEFFDAKWSLSGGHNSFKFSERFADLQLMPLEEIFRPAFVELKSWGRIKAFLED
jgi:hypothetical protein